MVCSRCISLLHLALSTSTCGDSRYEGLLRICSALAASKRSGKTRGIAHPSYTTNFTFTHDYNGCEAIGSTDHDLYCMVSRKKECCSICRTHTGLTDPVDYYARKCTIQCFHSSTCSHALLLRPCGCFSHSYDLSFCFLRAVGNKASTTTPQSRVPCLPISEDTEVQQERGTAIGRSQFFIRYSSSTQ
jgi:hypothetical protein